MERILPGEKVVTQAATTSSGGYNKAAATTDSTASSIKIFESGCTIAYTAPHYMVTASATLDTSNKDIGSLPADFSAMYRTAQGGPVGNLMDVGWATMFYESTGFSCVATGVSFPLSCYIQARLRFGYTGNEADVSTVGRVCTYTNSTTYSWSDFTYATN